MRRALRWLWDTFVPARIKRWFQETGDSSFGSGGDT